MKIEGIPHLLLHRKLWIHGDVTFAIHMEGKDMVS
jgi:hypothetical protein